MLSLPRTDSSSRKAGLRLDTSQGAFTDRGGSYPIVPKKPHLSLVSKRIQDHSAPMPPVSSGKTLTTEEILTINRWIEEGAQYGKLWSFESIPQTISIPKVSSNWVKNDIDKFILERLNKEGLKPSEPAIRSRWLRRVTLDLTGLPPTLEELERFTNDTLSGSFERVVDQLLSRPQFGEHMAVEWLDAARYSDSYGYQSDLISPTWPYRDWVVKAFNENMPYDRFLTEQIAGDLVAIPTPQTRLATAFNRLHRQSNEGGSIAEEFKSIYAADRVDTFGTAILGLTLGCARCHDHKYDPITQREYYQLVSFFNSIDEFGLLLSSEIVPTPSVLLPNKAQQEKWSELKDSVKVSTVALEASKENSDSRFQLWLNSSPVQSIIPDELAQFSFEAVEGDKFVNEMGGKSFGQKVGSLEVVPGYEGNAVQFDGECGLAIRGLESRDRWDPFSWSFKVKDSVYSKNQVVLLHRSGGTDVGFCGFDLVLQDGILTARIMRHWPGNAIAIRTKVQIPKDKWTSVGWTWDGSGLATGLKLFVGDHQAPIDVLRDHLWKKVNAYGDLGGSGGDWTFGTRFRDAGFKGGLIDDISYFSRSISNLEMIQSMGYSSLQIALKNSVSNRNELKAYYDSAIDPDVRLTQIRIQNAQRNLAEFEEGLLEVSVMEELPQVLPTYLLPRGQYDAVVTEADRVARSVPASLPQLKGKRQADRLSLAAWACSPENPLTSRVAVNRIWQLLFGTGLVETSENFGVQGSRPTHPELLDYLSRGFIKSKWNFKELVRQIVLSATYRQDSKTTPSLHKLDPQNRLYSRGPSQRLSAEMIRDTVLFASGLLDSRVGGPPVNPYQPAGIWRENNTMSPEFVQSKGTDLYRRSLYSTWKRTTPVPSMMLFDTSSREACTVRRQKTSTPLQALVLLNDIQFVEAARVLAESVYRDNKSQKDQFEKIFLLLAGRSPDPTESKILTKSFQEQLALFDSDQNSAKKLLHIGDTQPLEYENLAEIAALTIVVQTVMNSDVVLWKR